MPFAQFRVLLPPTKYTSFRRALPGVGFLCQLDNSIEEAEFAFIQAIPAKFDISRDEFRFCGLVSRACTKDAGTAGAGEGHDREDSHDD